MCTQRNLTCLQEKGKMTTRKNAKMLTMFTFQWWGNVQRFFLPAVFITRKKTEETLKIPSISSYSISVLLFRTSYYPFIKKKVISKWTLIFLEKNSKYRNVLKHWKKTSRNTSYMILAEEWSQEAQWRPVGLPARPWAGCQQRNTLSPPGSPPQSLQTPKGISLGGCLGAEVKGPGETW